MLTKCVALEGVSDATLEIQKWHLSSFAAFSNGKERKGEPLRSERRTFFAANPAGWLALTAVAAHRASLGLLSRTS